MLNEYPDLAQVVLIELGYYRDQLPGCSLEALHRFDFDTIMFPMSASIFRNAEYRKEAEDLLAFANARNVGIQTIKMIARGGWGDRARECTTWYDPHREQEDIDLALWWVLSQPMHTAPSAGDVTLLPKVLDAAERFTPMSKAEQEEAISSQRPPMPEPGLGILAAS